ncbi:MAG: hypothetical protein H7301_11360, partial [Cryobacterium sp.]|nr:hypothetical protein [Oligoflexia bacterium]
ITSDSKRGSFSVRFNGGDASCLNYTKLDMSKEKPAGLSKKEGSKLVPSASFSALSVISENPLSDRNREVVDNLNDCDDKPIDFKSPADIAAEKKKQDEQDRLAQTNLNIDMIASCDRDLTELDVADKALEKLLPPELAIAGKDAEWKAEQRKILDAKYFEKCSVQIRRASTEVLDVCDERLAKIVANDKSYADKVKKLYFSKLERFFTASAVSPEVALKNGLDTIDQMRRLSDSLEFSEKDKNALDAAEQQLYASTLDRAAKQGVNSEAFAKVAGEFKSFALDNDKAGCLDDNLGLVQSQRANPACKAAVQTAVAFGKEVQLAQISQNQINIAAQQKAAREQELAYADSCQLEKVSGSSSAGCAALDAKLAAQAKAQANAGISTGGFGEAVTTPAAMTATAPSFPQGGAVDNTAKNVGGLPAASTAPTAPSAPTVSAPVTSQPVAAAPAPVRRVY